MDLLNHLASGFAVAFTLQNLMWCFIGTLLGTLIGVLPGIGPVATIAMLLPSTYALEPVSALIMLAGIYYGAQYGGSTTAILVNMPGETSSAVTALDGYKLAQKGQAGAALSIAALSSFFAGCVATVLLAAFSPPLARFAFLFGPADYCALMTLGLLGAVVLSHGSVLKALAMIFLGLILGIVGTDVNSGIQRFAFGNLDLSDGIDVVVVAMGLFGFAEVVKNLELPATGKKEAVKVGSLWVSLAQLRHAFPAMLRGTSFGCVLGLLPGGGATLSSWASYAVEKKLSKDPRSFGEGNIRGVAAPEAANNAAAQSTFIPLLTLGIPENAVMAMMVGAMMIHDIQPGPRVITSNPELFWGLVASMWIGNLMLVILNLPLIGIWVRLLKVPYRLLYPAILLFCCVGVYSINSSTFAVLLTAAFGFIGVILMKLECEPAPLLLGLVLGPMFEENLRRALFISDGDWSVFITRPISCGILILAALLLVLVIVPSVSKGRQIFVEQE